MSLSKQGSSVSVSQQSPKNKGTCLNPNAAEFVPLFLRTSPVGTSNNPDPTSKFPASGSLGKQVLDRSESSISHNSDEEARQFWQSQLPDDITPDFKVMGDEDPSGAGTLSLAGLSLGHDAGEATSRSTYMLNEQGEVLSDATGFNFGNKLRYPLTTYGEDPSSASFLPLPAKSWENQLLSGERFVRNGGDSTQFQDSQRLGYNNMASENIIMENNDIDPIEFLASQFPGFAIESLAEVYFANSCDLHMTVEILAQLELQVDAGGGSFNQSPNSTAFSGPNLAPMEFPALSASHNNPSLPKFGGEEVPQAGNPYRAVSDGMLSFKSSSSSLPSISRDSSDFASVVRRLASQDSGMWKYERNSVQDSSPGSYRNSPVFDGSYNIGTAKGGFGDRLRSRGPGRVAVPPLWVETGEAVANLYSELREDARDHARLRNAFFEQARQAYLLGNKALAKELSAKGQIHNMQMKAAHSKAQESIYRQRNPSSHEFLGNGGRRGEQQERLIDLHGLHVSEAISLLRNELAALRGAAATVGIQVVYICVGTGHHTKGSRTPARLPVAVQRYLLEEGLDYSEPQPGLLRILLY